MAGLIEVDLDDVFAGLNEMVKAGRDLRPVFKDARKDLRVDLKAHFDAASGPDGAWAPRAPSTVARILSTGGHRRNVTRKGKVKKGAARRLANQLGRLKSAWRITYDKGQLVATSNVKWAGIHQFGGMAAKRALIPARPFAWVSDVFLGALSVSVAAHVARGWQK